MSESPVPIDESTDSDVVIAVVRSGGIAGISRRWRIEAAPADAPEWIALIDSCPWDAHTDAATGADRFVWSIRARTPAEHHERELPDSELAGPWLDLVKAVRDASRNTD
ncbi:hypothetical protein KZC51_04160 [Microbacterium sp. SSW1-49]|uniref:Uncharacterized protein n=1 Tax=Microbacterium croceum TaxID=2851645 RepID=A0ABT0FB88_9MICO|nr:protealysin inhibitor emfourin [Microbacterium croceum]MCK2035323.1 hypothetical protein [Microbacterium croceum]